LADGSNGKSAAGILVAHESPGITEHVKWRAEALAERGYVAFALDLFGARDLDLDEARRQSSLVMMTPGLMYARANAALTVLANQANVDSGRLAAIGFCLGGVTVLELARHGAPIKCAIGFHPGLKRPAGSPDGAIRAKVLMMIGDRDPIVPQEDRIAFAQSMNAAGADWELHVFGGVGHSYTNPAIDAYGLPGFGFDARANSRSWQMALMLLSEQVGRHPPPH
jgi:dienelactone hydrolase